MSEARRDAAIRAMAHEMAVEWMASHRFEGVIPEEVAAWAIDCARVIAEATPAADDALTMQSSAILTGHDAARAPCNCIACALERWEGSN